MAPLSRSPLLARRVDYDDGRRPRRMRAVGPIFALVWLVFLAEPWTTAWSAEPSAARTLSLLGILGVAAIFGGAIVINRRFTIAPRLAIAALAVQSACVALSCLVTYEAGLNGLVFVCVTALFILRTQAAVPVVALAVAATLVVPRLLGWGVQYQLTLSVLLASIAVIGFTQLIERNRQLGEAQLEVATLAVDRERERIARDMHDLLGHSLTVIAIKADLAVRLLDGADPRARDEVEQIRGLARTALADVRATVSTTRAVSLSRELAGARSACDAAGIDAEVPGSLDVVPERLRELFAWAVREGTTNVLRHANASRMRISFATDRVEIDDDGAGSLPNLALDAASSHSGSGIIGLRSRARAHGAIVHTGRSAMGGFHLAVIAEGES